MARSLRQQESFPAHGRHSSARKEVVLCFLPFNYLLDLKPDIPENQKGARERKGRKEEGRGERGGREGRIREERGGERKEKEPKRETETAT